MGETPRSERDPRWRELAATFGVELDERLRAVNRLLLGLEREGHDAASRAEQLRALMREVHSLKGGARAVELAPVEQLAHALESSLETALRGGADLAADWFDLVYRAVDTFPRLAHATVDNGAVPEFGGLVAALSEARPGVDGGTRVASAMTMPASPPGDVAGEEGGDGQAAPGQGSVRVAVAKLDVLLARAGELRVVARRIEQRLHELAEVGRDLDGGARAPRAAGTAPEPRAAGTDQPVRRRVEDLAARLRQDTVQLAQVTRAINDDVLSVRLLPVATIFVRLERMVRDLARATGKEARLLLEGGDTELDRRIVEQLADPLLHLLRNAVDHGLEPPGEREAHGKPRSGTIRVAARPRAGLVEIEVADDGAGLDPRGLRQRAVQQGLLAEAQAAVLDDAAAIALIFRPGFSTRARVTETSGRGVGMDVVRANVEAINGQIEVTSVVGRGTRFTLLIPLTLATTRTILTAQRGQLFAVPSAAVERSARLRTHELASLEGRHAVVVEGHPVPVVELADVLELPPGPAGNANTAGWRPYLVLRQADRRVAVLADELVGEQEVVVKPLAWPLRRVRNVSGTAVLGSGRTAVILNPADLLKTALKLVGDNVRATWSAEPTEARQQRRRVLVVDDSVITRTMERSVLEAAGYEVAAVGDGIEALRVLHAGSVDLVVADVEMPRMDGFALTAEMRRDEGLRQIPVVLVTSLDAREHRERGVAVGADAYIVKTAFDQGQLLRTIGRLL